MKFEYNKAIDSVILTTLYHSVEWSTYTDFPEKMEKILPNSLWWCACWDEDELVGLIRVVGDGISIVYVQDLLVHPDYQRKGIGTQLIKEMLATFAHVRQLVLITDNSIKTIEFYKSLGLKELSETNGIGFIHYNFEA